jgi:predicted Zn-dependent protease
VGLTLGLLATLKDEAELAFLLAHELAHHEQGGPGRRTAPRCVEPGLRGWLDRLPGGQRRDRRRLAEVFSRHFPLGYGPDAELAADARAVQILAERGYDTVAALRYLTRLEGRGPEAAGPAHLAPAASHRRERVSRTLAQIPRTPRPPIINKEVFQRAVGGFDVFARRAPGGA